MPLHFTPGAYGERFVVRDGDASGAHQFQNREERSHGLAAPPLLDEQLANRLPPRLSFPSPHVSYMCCAA